ncbi:MULTISPECIES: efflux transporter outer membrane subunit [unclassified Agarivorans]|uniref:efflux transporter outer membrane subunit n=1 Tax=unclassified Agarivorans TaxID=2636026 RepID=UPI0026E3FEE3|nr:MULTISPECIES: efflux transporter outer membrane subunit [unclassified Agarivorans]MDO6685400.1 efflux transporter outer membrane subunit [Agarivorans sp. 3_MG-2023]MDO6715786.1 efflux transporter outer membrane subunit [Agarivorans sp. 2_MG-2023]
MRLAAWVWIPALLATLTGCSMTDTPKHQPSGELAASSWTSQFQQGEFTEQRFEQALPPSLQPLLKEALRSNPQLQQQGFALDQQLYQIRIQNAQQWPSIDAFVSGQRSGTNNDSASQFRVGLDFSWEIDWLGKLDARQQAAVLDAKVSFEQWQQAQIRLAANTAQQWYNVIEAQLQKQLIAERYDNLKANLQIIEESYQGGLNSALDVYLARADLSAARAQLNSRTTQLTQAQRELELLLGRYPSGLIQVDGVLDVPLAAMPAGVPSELLNRRHDIKAAQYQLAAADLRVYAAYRDRFPSLTLTASGGGQSDQLGQLLDAESLVWSLFAGVTAPIFDAARRENQQLQQYAKAQSLNAAYVEQVLNSFAEVEQSLNLEPSLYQNAQLLATAAEDSKQAESLAFENYLAGLNEYVTVLESQRRAFDARSSAINALNLQLQNRIELYLALGGGLNQAQTTREAFASEPLF